MLYFIGILLAFNAFVSFATAFFFHALVIIKLLRSSSSGKDTGLTSSFYASFSKFVAGELYPDLKRKWSKAILWVVLSFIAAFLFAGVAELIPN